MLLFQMMAGFSGVPGLSAAETTLHQGTLETGSFQVPLNATPGDYLSGTLTVQNSPVSVYQAEPGNPHLREFAKATKGDIRLHLIVENPDTVLRIEGPPQTEFTLRLQHWGPSETFEQTTTDELASPRLKALSRSLSRGSDSVGFWEETRLTGTPLIEELPESATGEQLMTFLYRGARDNVRLIGGPSPDHDWLTQLPGSDVWFRSYRVPSSTRLSYKLAPDVPQIDAAPRARRIALLATAAADPLNRSPWPANAPDRWSQWSTVSLSDAPLQPGFPLAGAMSSDVSSQNFTSDLLGNTRTLSFYRSPGYDPNDPAALLLFMFDGLKAITQMQVPQMLDTLVTQGDLPPIAAIFIDPIDHPTRSTELPGNPLFSRFLATELLPIALTHFRLRHDRQRTVLAGASFGGIGATNAALDFPDLFGAVISLSGSYWWAPEGWKTATGLSYVAQRIVDLTDPPDIRFFIGAGRFETSRNHEADIRETSRQLHAVLSARGVPSTWREYSAGHDAFVWRGAFGDGLLNLFGR